jgi:hypothetical protein
MSESNDRSSDVEKQALQGVTTSPSLGEYYRERLESARQRLPEIARQLREAGVVQVLIEYDGCGDSGQIEYVQFLDAEGQALSGGITIPEAALMDAVYDLTEARHPGWENNDGAFGKYEWNLATGELEHVHNERFTDYCSTEHSGL